MNKLYHFPLRFKDLIKSKDLPETALVDSIAQNCTLIITARFKSHRYNLSYGCILWEKDFEILSTNMKWEEDVEASIQSTIIQNEPRLENVKVSTKYSEDVVQNSKTKTRYFRKTITISINGNIKAIGEQFYYKKNIYLSPIELN
jgi:predicted component of type VI protein secretion system